MNAEQQNQKNLESIMRLIRRAVKAGKFALCFANCSSLTDQNRYIEELRQQCAREEITLVDVSLRNRGTIANLRPIVHETFKQAFPDGELPPKLAIQVTRLEISILLDPDEQFPAVLQTMNMGREGFAKEFPYPFLIWLPDYAYTKLANVAPDFWSVCYGSYSFSCDQEATKLGDAYRFLGKTEKARTSYDEALRLSREIGDSEREETALERFALQ